MQRHELLKFRCEKSNLETLFCKNAGTKTFEGFCSKFLSYPHCFMVPAFRTRIFLTRLHKGLCSATLGHYRSDVASQCFRSSSFKIMLHQSLCSTTSGCYRSDVAVRCLQIEVLRQGCTSAYVASLKVVKGRMQRLSVYKFKFQR